MFDDLAFLRFLLRLYLSPGLVEGCHESGLPSSGVVLVQDAFLGGSVQSTDGIVGSFFSGLQIASFDVSARALDVSAHCGLDGLVAQVPFFRSSDPLLCRLVVCQLQILPVFQTFIRVGLFAIGLPCQAEFFALEAGKKGGYILWSGEARPQDVPFLPNHLPSVKPEKAPFPLCQKSRSETRTEYCAVRIA